jgi:regulatory protein
MRQSAQFSTEDELYAAAIRALARRAHSVAEMRKYLGSRAAERAVAGRVLSRLKAAGLLDDARYARQFARARAANRSQGSFRIARELRARGVPDRHINAALEEICAPMNDAAVIRRRIENWLKRRGIAAPAALDRNRVASLYRSLFRAGFSADQIRDEIRRLGREPESLPECPNQEEA